MPDDFERKQLVRFIANAVKANSIAAEDLLIFGWDPDAPETKQAVVEIIKRSELITDFAKALYTDKNE